MADFDLLVLGDCNPDLLVRGQDVEPAFGQVEQLVDEARLVVGGSGSITACGAARLGLRTAFAGVVGDDVFGRFMLDALAERGVDTSGCIVHPTLPTGLSVILSRPGGADRAILTLPGTIAALTAESVDHDLIRGARHVHVASYFLQDALRPGLPGLFAGVRARGATTSIDPNWDPSGSWDGGLRALLPLSEVFLPNASEAILIAGSGAADDDGAGRSGDGAEAAAGRLAESGPLVAVKLGAEGAVAVREHQVRTAAAPDVEFVDATGAGDSFDAGFLSGFLAGWSLERTLSLACACGALSTRALGGTAAQPTLDEAAAVVTAAGTRMESGP